MVLNKDVKLNRDSWYWVSNPQEGDIFYPVYVNADGAIVMDGVQHDYESVSDLEFTPAIMPTQ